MIQANAEISSAVTEIVIKLVKEYAYKKQQNILNFSFLFELSGSS
jgi:hypothetical protein